MSDWIAAIAAAAGLVVAVLAWLTARRAAQAGDNSAAAAASAAKTAEEVATIERDRWHRELTPELDLHLTQQNMGAWLLAVELTGPPGLDHLDGITLEVLDEKGIVRRPNPAAGITEDDLSQVIWGPLRLRPGVDGVTAPGRHSTVARLELGEQAVRALEVSPAPPWYNDRTQPWARVYADHKLRIKAVCSKDGHRPWISITELDVPRT